MSSLFGVLEIVLVFLVEVPPYLVADFVALLGVLLELVQKGRPLLDEFVLVVYPAPLGVHVPAVGLSTLVLVLFA